MPETFTAVSVPEGRWPYPSKSDPTTTYEVWLRSDGRISCDCRGWTVLKPRKGYRACSHTDQQEAKLGAYTFATIGTERFVIRTDGVVQELGIIAQAAALAPMDAEARSILIGHGARELAEQDALDADARHADRREAQRYYQPQLASPNDDGLELDALTGWVMEQKFDGHRMSVRVTAGVATAWARPGAGISVGIPTVLHPAIASCFETVPDGFYDGELVVPSGTSSDVRALVNSGKQALILFDACEVLGVDVTRKPWVERRQLLEGAALGLKAGGPVSVAAYLPPSQAGVEAIWAAGGEGVILKRTSAVYVPGARSKDWIKIKATEEVVLEIIGFEDGKSFGPHSVLLVRDVATGIETKTKTKNAEWARRIKAGTIAVGTRIEAVHYGRTRHAFRHLMAKRVEGEA